MISRVRRAADHVQKGLYVRYQGIYMRQGCNLKLELIAKEASKGQVCFLVP